MAVTAIGGGFFYLKLVEITDNQAAAKARGLAILEDGDRTEQLLLNATAVACRLLLDDPAVADICADPDISELLAGS